MKNIIIIVLILISFSASAQKIKSKSQDLSKRAITAGVEITNGTGVDLDTLLSTSPMLRQSPTAIFKNSTQDILTIDNNGLIINNSGLNNSATELWGVGTNGEAVRLNDLSSFGIVPFSNGLTSGKLGGTMSEDTEISMSNFDISFTGVNGGLGLGYDMASGNYYRQRNDVDVSSVHFGNLALRKSKPGGVLLSIISSEASGIGELINLGNTGTNTGGSRVGIRSYMQGSTGPNVDIVLGQVTTLPSIDHHIYTTTDPIRFGGPLHLKSVATQPIINADTEILSLHGSNDSTVVKLTMGDFGKDTRTEIATNYTQTIKNEFIVVDAIAASRIITLDGGIMSDGDVVTILAYTNQDCGVGTGNSVTVTGTIRIVSGGAFSTQANYVEDVSCTVMKFRYNGTNFDKIQ